MNQNPDTQYATDANLAKRQRLWSESRRDPEFDLYLWVLDLAGVHDGDTRAVPDRVVAARRIRRVLRAGGTGVVVTNGQHNFAEFKRLMEHAVGTVWTMRRHGSRRVHGLRRQHW